VTLCRPADFGMDPTLNPGATQDINRNRQRYCDLYFNF
jgi:hypothetical protein